MEDREMLSNAKKPTLRDYLRIIFRYKILFIIIPPIMMIPVYLQIQFVTPRYKAEVKMLVTAQRKLEADYFKEIFLGDIALDHAELIKSNIVLERVVRALKLYEIPPDYEMRFASPLKAAMMKRTYKNMPDRLKEMSSEQKEKLFFGEAVGNLRSRISAEDVRGTSLLNISAEDFDPNLATKIANSLSRSYVIFDLEQQIAELKLKYGEKHAKVLHLENYIKEFDMTLDGRRLPDIEAIGPASIKIVQQAVAGPVPRMNNSFLSVAFFVGIFFSIVLAFVFDYFDHTFKLPLEIETFLNIPCLGTLPKRKLNKSNRSMPIKSMNPQNIKYSMALRSLSDEIYLGMRNRNQKSLLMIGLEEEENVSVIADLGTFLSDVGGHKVLIIDADIRGSKMPDYFNVSVSDGIVDLLEDKIGFEDAIQDLSSNLHILPGGDTAINPHTIFDSHKVSNIIEKAKERYEIILINCASVKNCSDAVVLSSFVDGIALMINEGKVRRQVISNAIKPLILKNVNLVGAILNNHTYPIPEIIYKLI
jgi:capsular polysaccharide biosynthesis protein